jgi:polysaccharide biosynthesis/export protein
MSLKKSLMFAAIIAVTGLFFIAEAAAQTTRPRTATNGSAPQKPQLKTAPDPAAPGAAEDGTAADGKAANGTAADADAEAGLNVNNIMRKFRETYRLGPDDELAVRVLKQPDYSIERTKVSPVGSIYHQLLGEIQVAGLTVEQLKKHLTAELSEYVIDPVVYIELLTASSAKIGVIGEVSRPGIIVMTRPMRLLDAINEAGGITDLGKKSSVTVLRQPPDGNQQLIEVNVKRILQAKATPEENIALQAGDTVIVNGNTMKTLTKISAVTGFASLLSFIAIGGGK